MVGRLRRWRPCLVVSTLAVLGLVAGGCSVAGIDMAIDDACAKAGVAMVDWDVSDTRPTVLTVVYDGTGGDGVPAAEGEAGHLAEAVWTGVPVGFQRLTLQSRAGTVTGTWTRAELTELYGPRPPGLDRDYDRGLGADLAGLLLVPILLGVVLATAIAAVIAWRGRHRPGGPAWPPPAPPALPPPATTWAPERVDERVDPGRVRPAWLP
jgi:hypothetical protein